MRIFHRIRQSLLTPPAGSRTGLFQHHTQIFCRVQLLIRAFYAFLAFLTILLIRDWPGILGRGEPQALWPVFWLAHVNLRMGIQLILLLYTGGALLAAAAPQWRVARIMAFLGVLQFWAFNNSSGKIGHSLHGVLLVSFIFILLPTGWHDAEEKKRLTKQSTLLIFWIAQGALMMTYSMAGMIKVVAGIYQLIHGQPNVFFPDALARHVADRLLQTDSRSLYGEFLISHLWLSYPLMLGTIYLEFFAFLTLFRPRLQPAFVVGLVLFHISSYFTMTIIFPENCFLLFLFFAGMPLLRGPWVWSNFWQDWPIFGDGWALWQKRAS